MYYKYAITSASRIGGSQRCVDLRVKDARVGSGGLVARRLSTAPMGAITPPAVTDAIAATLCGGASGQQQTASRAAPSLRIYGLEKPTTIRKAVESRPVSLETATLAQLREIDGLGAAAWYDAALRLARAEKWAAARRVFQALTQRYPNLCRAWVSWAQMEKRANATYDDINGSKKPGYACCRAILQRGLTLNPDSSCLCQAWGLLELQRGNAYPAVKLIDRSVQYDPGCIPVQRWRLYQDARRTVSSTRRTRPL